MKSGKSMSKGGLADALAGERPQEKAVLANSREPCEHRNERGKEQRCIYDPSIVQDKDAEEGGDQGWEERDVRQCGCREGEASKDHREGLHRGGLEAQLLRPFVSRTFLRG